jgi:hypothetical protein
MAFISSVISLGLIGAASAASINMDSATLALWHSENAYCSPDTYLTRPNKAATLDGFVPTYHIDDPLHDTEGYIGYNSKQSRIFVSFRGSESIQNWLSDLDMVLTPYESYGCSGCNVHKGFYTAEQKSLAGILSEVKSLKEQFPSYSVMVTGHSLGAALATLTAIDVQGSGIGPVSLYNFGSPRVGDVAFSEWASSYITDANRVTHHKDMVVHTPPHGNYQHISGEWYEPDNSASPINIDACSGYEDPSCSYQWTITSIDDHLWYLNVTMGTGGCSEIL